MNKSCITQPLNGILIFCRSSSFSDCSEDEFFIFFCKLSRNRIPYNPYLCNFIFWSMFCYIIIIVMKDCLLNFSYTKNILSFDIFIYTRWQTTGKIILTQKFNERTFQRFYVFPITAGKDFFLLIFSHCQQKFIEIKRIEF